MNNGIIYIIGHGGAGFISLDNKLPINSFKSVTKAIEKQNADCQLVWMVEEVRLTALVFEAEGSAS
ncbi:MAG: hypothetical protein HRT73_15870, partial [Flavobacteriales bacterium]|nr:hypothetical protein [Flavobacteriales bacterium]